MGTRHMIGVVVDGDFKVAQYGQWDGFPDGQGQKIVDFLLSDRYTGQRETFLAHLRAARFASPEEVKAAWIAAGASPDSDMVGLDVADKFKAANPQLSRDCGAKVLDYVLLCVAPVLKDSRDFAGDSLFCEYAYVLDMDGERLEVYRGFNQRPVPEGQRFAHLPAGNGYFPVRLLFTFPFAELTSDSMAQLVVKSDDEAAAS